MSGRPEPLVAIAGDGVAGAVLACLLRRGGFGVVVLGRARSRRPPRPFVEAVSEATARLFAEVGLASQLARAGAMPVEGFENNFGPAPRRIDGRWLHVDRGRLAAACLAEAGHCGATLVAGANVSERIVADGTGVSVGISGARVGAFAAIDATGRRALWSRPVSRERTADAALYVGPGVVRPRSGRIAGLADGWAYSLEHPDATTVGVVTTRPNGPLVGAKLATCLQIEDASSFAPARVRPAGVQWADDPVGPGRLSVGDAALAYSPMAGTGLRFALSSALAVAAVLTSWAAGERVAADSYYRSMVAGARRRHLAQLTAFEEPIAPDGPPSAGIDGFRHERLDFGAAVVETESNQGGRIVAERACVLGDGGMARWAGGFDLLALREVLSDGCSGAEASERLQGLGLPTSHAEALLEWSVRHGLVMVADLSQGRGRTRRPDGRSSGPAPGSAAGARADCQASGRWCDEEDVAPGEAEAGIRKSHLAGDHERARS